MFSNVFLKKSENDSTTEGHMEVAMAIFKKHFIKCFYFLRFSLVFIGAFFVSAMSQIARIPHPP